LGKINNEIEEKTLKYKLTVNNELINKVQGTGCKVKGGDRKPETGGRKVF